MNIELTEEQSQALATGPHEPLILIDPRTQQAYHLVKLGSQLDSPWTGQEMAVLAGVAFGKLDDEDYSHYLQDKP